MSVPWRCATCQMVSPLRAWTSWPSSVNATVSPPWPSPCTLSAGPVCATCGRPSTLVSPPAAPLLSWPYPTGLVVSFMESPFAQRPGQIVAEILEHAEQRVRRGLSQPADRGISHRGGQFGQQRLVPRPGCHQLDRLLGSCPARRALSAALILEKAHQVERHRLHVVALGQDHDRVG